MSPLHTSQRSQVFFWPQLSSDARFLLMRKEHRLLASISWELSAIT